MFDSAIRPAAISGLLLLSITFFARASAQDVGHQFSALVAQAQLPQERAGVVRAGSELIQFSASLTDGQREGLAAPDVDILLVMANQAPPPRRYLAAQVLGELGRRAADALPILQELSWQEPELVCESDEKVCVRTGPPAYVVYMIAFEDIRADLIAHGQKPRAVLERGNDVRIQRGIERVLAERDPTSAEAMMVELAQRASQLPPPAMDRLEDSTLDLLAGLLDAAPGIRFEAAAILGHARTRATRALPALERSKTASVGVPTKWHLNGALEPISGEDYLQEVINRVSLKR